MLIFKEPFCKSRINTWGQIEKNMIICTDFKCLKIGFYKPYDRNSKIWKS